MLPTLLLALCPQDVAHRAVDPQSGHTYVRTEEPLSVYDADALARAMGGTLVTITSAEEETFLLENFGATELYWIGLEYPRYTWATGEPMGFAHWFPGEPAATPVEPFTLMNWSDPGAWVDVIGDVDGERYRALIELPAGVAAEPVPPVPARGHAERGVLLMAVQGLTQKDLENPRNPNLFALWKGSAWTDDAGADGSGEALAGLGMLLWGTGSSRSELSAKDPRSAARRMNLNLLSRLEDALHGVTTAALLDDPALAGILLDGRVDVRSSNASPRRGGSEESLRDALGRPTPACLVVTWTTPEILGGDAPPDTQRAKDLAAVDREIGVLLEGLRGRASFADEEWMIALCGLAPVMGKKTRADDLRARTAVPLVVVGGPLAPGEILADVGLVDLVPSAMRFLGVEPRASYALDGRGLERPLELGTNLVVNGDGEAQFDWSGRPWPQLVGWRQLAPFRLVNNRPSEVAERGQSSFQGAAGALAWMEQTIDLRALADDVARGSLRYSLAGTLGVRGNGEESIELALEFLSDQKKTLERAVLGPLGGKKGRGDDPDVPRRLETAGRVPRRTAAARLVLRAQGEKVERTLADGLSLILERE